MSNRQDQSTGVLMVAITPRTETDRPRLLSALEELSADDATFAYTVEPESGEIKLHGAGESQLGAQIEAIEARHRISVTAGPPEVAYRETIAQPTQIDYTHKKISGEFARVAIIVAPKAYEGANLFESKVTRATLPEDYMIGVERGTLGVLPFGVLAGFPVIGVSIALIDATYHETDSSPLAFEIAARAAVREALQRCPVLLEPIMKVALSAPAACAGQVVRDLRSRRGEIEQQSQGGDLVAITALVPLANLFGYDSSLRSRIHGRGSHRLEFSHYAPVPVPDDPSFRPAVAMRA